MNDSLPLSYEQSQTQRLIYTFINSTAAFVLAYWVYWLLGNYFAGVLAGTYNWKSSLAYNGMSASPIEGIYYRKRSVIAVYMTPTIITFILMVASVIVFQRFAKARSDAFKPFFFWLIMHSCNYLFGGMSLAALFSLMQVRYFKGIGHSFEWAQIPEVGKYFIMGIAIIIEVLIGFMVTHISMMLAQHKVIFGEKRPLDRILFSTFNVLLPWVAGSFIVLGPRIQEMSRFDMMTVVVMGAMVIPIISFSQANIEPRLPRTSTNRFVIYSSLVGISAAATMLVYFIFAGNGIQVSSGN